MICPNKLIRSGRYVGCGQCMACRIQKKREWSGKILLEALHSPNPSSFITLTYDEENYPDNGTLIKQHAVSYINRLRAKSSLGAFRYFLVGEYGERTGRAHYHMALFNVPPENWEHEFSKHWHTGQRKKSSRTQLGFVHVGEVTRASASYISGYTTKKLTNRLDPRLEGKHPEFSLFSKFPPIGAAGMNHIFDLMHTQSGARALAAYKDIPSGYQCDGKNYPFSTYWRDWLRAEMGVTNPPQNAAWDIDIDAFTREQQDAEKKIIKFNRTVKKGHARRTF